MLVDDKLKKNFKEMMLIGNRILFLNRMMKTEIGLPDKDFLIFYTKSLLDTIEELIAKQKEYQKNVELLKKELE